MNIRHYPLKTDFFRDTSTNPSVASEPFGYDLNFQAVGRPWRYEFPHQPSTSDPEMQPRFTIPAPVPVVQPRVVLAPVPVAPPMVVPTPQSGTTPQPASPPAVDPADPT